MRPARAQRPTPTSAGAGGGHELHRPPLRSGRGTTASSRRRRGRVARARRRLRGVSRRARDARRLRREIRPTCHARSRRRRCARVAAELAPTSGRADVDAAARRGRRARRSPPGARAAPLVPRRRAGARCSRSASALTQLVVSHRGADDVTAEAVEATSCHARSAADRGRLGTGTPSSRGCRRACRCGARARRRRPAFVLAGARLDSLDRRPVADARLRYGNHTVDVFVGRSPTPAMLPRSPSCAALRRARAARGWNGAPSPTSTRRRSRASSIALPPRRRRRCLPRRAERSAPSARPLPHESPSACAQWGACSTPSIRATPGAALSSPCS